MGVFIYPPATAAASAVTYDFSGAVGALSDGLIAGTPWTVFGVGSGLSVGVWATISDIVAGFDGDLHTLQALVRTYAAPTWGVEECGNQIRHANSADTVYIQAYDYRGTSTTDRFQQSKVSIAAAVQDQIATSPAYVTRRTGLISSSVVATGVFSSDAGSGGELPTSLARPYLVGSVREAYSAGAVYSTTDKIYIRVLKYAGSNLTGSVVRGASGIAITLGGHVWPVSTVTIGAIVP